MKTINGSSIYAAIILIALIGVSCSDDYTPKPRGYHRIEFPDREYRAFDENCPFTFEYSAAAELDYSRIDRRKHPCRFNLYYPIFDAKLYFTYFGDQVKDSLPKLTEDSRELVKKHMVKARDIDERLFKNDERRVYGLTFDFKGSTATNYQFFLTDSTDHYLHSSMYFEFAPNPDSIDPVEDYIKKDIEHLIETFRWKD